MTALPASSGSLKQQGRKRHHDPAMRSPGREPDGTSYYVRAKTVWAVTGHNHVETIQRRLQVAFKDELKTANDVIAAASSSAATTTEQVVRFSEQRSVHRELLKTVFQHHDLAKARKRERDLRHIYEGRAAQRLVDVGRSVIPNAKLVVVFLGDADMSSCRFKGHTRHKLATTNVVRKDQRVLFVSTREPKTSQRHHRCLNFVTQVKGKKWDKKKQQLVRRPIHGNQHCPACDPSPFARDPNSAMCMAKTGSFAAANGHYHRAFSYTRFNVTMWDEIVASVHAL